MVIVGKFRNIEGPKNGFCKYSKILNTFLFLFSNKTLLIRVWIHKMLVRIAKRETLIRLLLQKQSDLGLLCLSRIFWQAISVQNLEHLPYKEFQCIL